MRNYTDYNSWIKRFFVFFHERFPLHASIPIILFFVLGNEAIAVRSMSDHFHPWRTLIALLMCISFFYRLVIFSDIRDYKDDCKWHPHKPLPRGLISVREGTIAAFALIIFEMFLTALVGIHSFLAHLLPISWSLLMWREFFAPKWLSHHPLFYTFIRAPVLALCGYSVGVTTLEMPLTHFPFPFFWFGLANWAIFCLFLVSNHSCNRRDAINFRYILGRRNDYMLMLGFAVLAAAVGMDIWLWIGVIAVCISGYLWLMRATSRMTTLMHKVNYGFMLYFYCVLSLSLLLRIG